MSRIERIKEFQRWVGAEPDGVVGIRTQVAFAAKFKKTRVQTVMAIANIWHESDGFTYIREVMSYRPERIMEIFGVGRHSAKVTPEEAKRLSGKPYELAERVYGLGNPYMAKILGNTRPGDGYIFRGGGGLHCTGGGDYMKYGGPRLYNNPELIDTEEFYFPTALAELDAKSFWRRASDLSVPSIQACRRVVNGGLNGIKDVIEKVRYFDAMWDKAK